MKVLPRDSSSTELSGASGELFNMTYHALLSNRADIFVAIAQDVCNGYQNGGRLILWFFTARSSAEAYLHTSPSQGHSTVGVPKHCEGFMLIWLRTREESANNRFQLLFIYNYTTTQCKLPGCKCSICASGWMKKHHQRKLQRVMPPCVQVDYLR